MIQKTKMKAKFDKNIPHKRIPKIRHEISCFPKIGQNEKNKALIFSFPCLLEENGRRGLEETNPFRSIRFKSLPLRICYPN